MAGAENELNEVDFNAPGVTEPFGAVGDAILSPLARWDAAWYLAIADHGYGPAGAEPDGPAPAFFPLYPLLVWLASGVGASNGLQLVAAFAVSLAAYGGALYLLHRLTELELGRGHALPAIALLALFPGALYFGIPYSESVFLLVSVGAFYAARTGHWAWAGVLAAAASATRSAGVLLVVPLLLIALWGPDRSRRDAAWLALAPLGLVAYCAYLGIRHDDALAWLHLQEAWARHFAGPFGGLWDGTTAAWDGVRQLASGQRETVYFDRTQEDPYRVAVENIALLGFALAALAATVGTFRRLPAAYGAYVVVALALPLSFPADHQPLMSLPRFLAVLFPLFMWLAAWCEERGRTQEVALAFTALLGLFTAQFAAWEWVA